MQMPSAWWRRARCLQSASSPLVFEIPKGLMAGMMLDAWQRSLTDLGVVGPDKGEGGKHLILGLGQEDPKAEGYIVIRSTTRNVFFEVRLLDPDRDRAVRELVPQMRSTTPGFGQHYMGVYQGKDGGWLVGGSNYRLHVPANPPAKQFWSVTVYDEKNRQMLVNETKCLDISSRNPAVVKNADGSTDVYVGPTAPKGFENNWVQTKPGEGWFVLFRFYGPTEKLFDTSWVLGDFEKVK
jgi:hypothetical protein